MDTACWEYCNETGEAMAEVIQHNATLHCGRRLVKYSFDCRAAFNRGSNYDLVLDVRNGLKADTKPASRQPHPPHRFNAADGKTAREARAIRVRDATGNECSCDRR